MTNKPENALVNKVVKKVPSWLLPIITTAVTVIPMTLILTLGNVSTSLGVGIISAVAAVLSSFLTKRKADREIESLRQQFKITREVERLEEKLPKLEQEVKKLLKERNDISTEITTLEETVNSYKENIREIEASLNRTKGEYDQLESSKAELTIKVNDLKQESGDLDRRIAQINLQNPDLATKENLHREIESKKLTKITLEEEVKALELKLINLVPLKAELASLEVSLASKKEELRLIQEKSEVLAKKAKELEDLTKTLQTLKLEHNKISVEKQQLEAIVAEIVKEIEELKQQNQDKNQERQTIQKDISILNTNLNNRQVQLTETQHKQEALDIEVKALKKKAAGLEIFRVTYDALFQESRNHQQQVDKLKPEIEGLKLQKQKIIQEIQEREKQYYNIEQKREELRKLEAEIREKRTVLGDLNRNNTTLEAVKQALEEKKASLEEEKANLDAKLRELKGEIDILENDGKVALKALTNPLWSKLPQQSINTLEDEKEFLRKFSESLRRQGLSFSERVIKAFHTSLKVQDISALVILAGISGTGKSELPQRYAQYMGAQMLNLAVQPRWDSPQDLQGFYNYIEKKYKPTDLMRGLYQYQNDAKMSDRLVIVLLDEMNLARVEYYFSDFLSKLETRRSQDTYLDLDVGSLPLSDKERRLKIPHEFLFVGTMNEDETTQSLSDKVLDRANVITFGKPQTLKLREENRGNGGVIANYSNYVSYSQFKRWIRQPDPNSKLVESVRSYLDETNIIMEHLGHPFAHRVYQAITCYVVNYPGVIEPNSEEFRGALADQFGQKLLPKLRGIMIDEYHDELESFGVIINRLGDVSLIKAFEQAKEGRFGQFQWRGFVYPDESK